MGLHDPSFAFLGFRPAKKPNGGQGEEGCDGNLQAMGYYQDQFD